MTTIKWAVRNCFRHAEFFVKVDDDFVVDVARLSDYIGFLLKNNVNSRFELKVRYGHSCAWRRDALDEFCFDQ